MVLAAHLDRAHPQAGRDALPVPGGPLPARLPPAPRVGQVYLTKSIPRRWGKDRPRFRPIWRLRCEPRDASRFGCIFEPRAAALWQEGSLPAAKGTGRSGTLLIFPAGRALPWPRLGPSFPWRRVAPWLRFQAWIAAGRRRGLRAVKHHRSKALISSSSCFLFSS